MEIWKLSDFRNFTLMMLLSAEVCPPQSADVDSFWHKGAPQSRPDLIEFHCDPSLLPVFVLTACVCLAVFCPSHIIHIHHVFPEEGCVRSALFSISVFSLLKGLRHWAHITLLSPPLFFLTLQSWHIPMYTHRPKGLINTSEILNIQVLVPCTRRTW